MAHLGLICPAATGHLNTVLPLGKELQARGHRVTLFGLLDAQASTSAVGLGFRAIGEAAFPSGAIARSWAEMGKLSGLAALRRTVRMFRDVAAVMLLHAPSAMREAGVEGLLVDQASVEGSAIADFLDIPFVTVCSALVLNQEESVPPPVTGWRYDASWWARLRNRAGYRVFNQLVRPIRNVVAEYRRQWRLPLHSHPNRSFSQLAQISQQPAELEFPRKELPPWFHFTGPFHSSSGRSPAVFPFEKLTGQPLIYASMGSIINDRAGVFRRIAGACAGLDSQLVISLGGASNAEPLPGLPGSPIVVSYAPQLELLKRAALTITHAGLNTTLESLSNGVPIVAIPITNDQPGVAARVSWAGAGEVVPLSALSVRRLRRAVERVLTEPSYKTSASRLKEAIGLAGGVKRAADIVEQAISTRRPVFARTYDAATQACRCS